MEENELHAAGRPVDVFCLRWTGMRTEARAGLPLVSMQCEIRYGTDGSAASGGMDRGRMLAAMDAELMAAGNAAPQNCLKTNYVTDAAIGSRVFWGDVVFGPTVTEEERLLRVVTVEVFTYQEAGER